MLRLVVWVEGRYDQWFVDAVIKPRLETKYAQVVVKEYRQKETAEVNRLLRKMAHQGFGRLFFADLDYAPCITDRKEKVKERYPSIEDREIIVVSREIECWYLGGLSPKGAGDLKIEVPSSTDRLAKEDLRLLRPPKLETAPFLLELLEHFDPNLACQRNKSFAYFYAQI